MTASLIPCVGGVPSADIAVPEHERELQFYSRVLGTGQEPLWREDLMNNMGQPVIGLGARSAEYADLPLQWMPHIQVADVGASVARAVVQGGSELMRHKDEQGQSQWAVLLDPNGAAFGIIPVLAPEATPQPSSAASLDAASRVGRISRLDLTVADAPTTREFYRLVVGWSARDVEMEDAGGRYSDYALYADDGSAIGGVHHARGVNEGLPPVWLIGLPVGDLAESLDRVAEGDGEVVQARQGGDGEYVYAVVRDPVGAWLALVPG